MSRVAVGKRILVVDDCIDLRRLVRHHLEGVGYQVFTASNIFEGIRIIRSEPLDCVICDLRMPEGDGTELVKEIRAEEQFADLPILMLSAVGALHTIRDAKQAGATAWIIKPYEREIFIDAVNALTVGREPRVNQATSLQNHNTERHHRQHELNP